MRLVVDIETNSPADLPSCGAYNYAHHPETKIICFAWADADDADSEPRSWSLLDGDEALESALCELRSASLLIAHNANFERHCMGVKWPEFANARRWRCSSMLSGSCGRPLGLDKACRSLLLPSNLEKDSRGKRLLNLYSIQSSKLYRGLSNIYEPGRDHDEFCELVEYCRQDVRAERAVWRSLEIVKDKYFDAQWILDTSVEDTGIPVDALELQGARALFEQFQNEGEARAAELTNGLPLRSTVALRKWTAEQGYALESFSRSAVAEALANTVACDEAPNVAELLKIRRQIAGTAGKKFDAFINNICNDGRIRGALVSRGAHTGRYTGKGIQPQNLPRGFIDPDFLGIVRACAHMAGEGKTREGAELLKLVAGGAEVDALASLCRDSICAPKGRVFVVADYSAVEARVLAWLSREAWVEDIFKSDGKIYERTAAAMYKKAVESVTKHERMAGKIATLALGYGGGAVALQRFATAYGVEFTDDGALEIVRAWRESRPKTTGLWRDLMNKFLACVNDENRITVGKLKVGNIASVQFVPMLIAGRDVIRMVLPSGRAMTYWAPKVCNTTGDVLCETFGGTGAPGAEIKGAVYNRIYGGILAENLTQAVAFDLLLNSLLAINQRRDLCRIVMHIHDEIVVECDEKDADEVKKFVQKSMETVPAWATGLPLKAEPEIMKRYKK